MIAIDEARLATASLSELGAMLRGGETTPTALAEYYLQRLDTTGRHFNAVVTLTEERALREARRAEEELRAGIDRGPLHGIPYGAKDLLATAGYATTWGAAPLREQRFTEDATLIQRLERAGAVLVAKLAMVELAGGMGYDQPNASLTGPGLNPWNREAWSGGSSSGSGSAVGARAVPFAIGSETQGSITTPSSYCGVSGLRPTYGRVSRHGAMALCWTLDKLGPMCRCAADCGIVLAAIAGRDAADPTSLDAPYRDEPGRGRSAGFRFAVLKHATEGAQPEVRQNFEAAVEQLRAVATIEEVELPAFPYQQVARIIIAAEASSAFDEFLDRGVAAELTAPEDRVRPYAYAVISARDYLRAMRIRAVAARELDAVMARYDALLAPTTPAVASPIDQSFSRSPRRGSGASISAAGNLAGLPAISVPSGFGERGLPTAIQFVGRALGEQSILAAARAYQSLTDWHRRTPANV